MDWVTASSLATAGGTLVLAVATFASVRSSNRAARLAERSLLAGTRPLLMPSRLEDPTQKVGFADGKWMLLEGGTGAAEATADVVYLAISVRNAGSGIAVLHGWRFLPERRTGQEGMPPIDSFRRLTRDLYIAAADSGFWQGAFRDPAAPEFAVARAAVEARSPLTVDVLYGDEEGGQRVVTSFALTARPSGAWTATVSRHWHVDRPSPR